MILSLSSVIYGLWSLVNLNAVSLFPYLLAITPLESPTCALYNFPYLMHVKVAVVPDIKQSKLEPG